jgi:hypothetical protein
MNHPMTFRTRTTILAGVLTAILGATDVEARVVHEKGVHERAHAEETVSITADTNIRLTLAGPLSSEFSRAGDRFQLFVADPVMVNGKTVVSAGTPVTGMVTLAKPCGRLSRQGRLGIELDSLTIGHRQLPLVAVHTPAASDKVDAHHVLHGITHPARVVANGVFAGIGDTPSVLAVPHRPDDKSMEQPSYKADLLTTDPLELVELPSDRGRQPGQQIARRGMAAGERVAANMVNVVMGGGPFGLLKRGAAVEIAPGTTVHAVLIAAN